MNFSVRAGQVVALLGPNGAGKTTAVKLLLGLIQPNSGKVRVFGGNPTNPQNRMRTGAMLQVGKVPETLRVREHIDLAASFAAGFDYDRFRADPRTVYAVTRCLEIISEASRRRRTLI